VRLLQIVTLAYHICEVRSHPQLPSYPYVARGALREDPSTGARSTTDIPSLTEDLTQPPSDP